MVRARAAEEAARRDAESARRIKDFMVGIFDRNDPYSRGGENVTARSLLDEGAAQLRHELAGEPELRADVMAAVGTAYMALGAHDRAEPILSGVVAERSARGAGGEELAAALERLGELRFRQARYAEASELLERALATRAPGGADAAWTMSLLARVHAAHAELDEARALVERALALHRKHGDDRGIVSSLRQLGILSSRAGSHDEAMRLYEEAHAIARRVLGEDHPTTLDLRESIALVQSNLGEHDAAERAHREVLEARLRAFGDGHVTLAYSYHNLGRALATLGRNDEAIPMYERAVAIRESALGPDHPEVAHTVESLAIARATAGELAASENLFERAFGIYRAVLGAQHPETLESLQNLAILAAYQDRHDLAVERMEEAVELGYDDLDVMLAPPLDALVGRPRYDALVERVRSRAPR
jgi:tetratricopeptide (TPR) repeat protein